MRVSRQRALIALQSFESVSAAAKSLGVETVTLLRMTLKDQKLAEAYRDCVNGVVRKRESEKRKAEKREREAKKPRVTERTAERRKARFFAATGRDPRLAAASLHKRLNHERRQEKAADLEAAIDAVDALIEGRPVVPTKRVLDVFDRWCGRCKSERVDDPCEVCGMHTIQHKGAS